jgi:hypothetical protein
LTRIKTAMRAFGLRGKPASQGHAESRDENRGLRVSDEIEPAL